MADTACAAGQSCSVACRVAGEPLIGTAATHDLHVFLEVASPWSAPVTESRHFPRAVRAVLARAWEEGRSVRVLAIEPRQELRRPGTRRLIAFRRPPPPFATYTKDEFAVPEREVANLLTALIDRPHALDTFASLRQETDHLRDLFVCTHAEYDACCGVLGAPLADQLRTYTVAADRLRVFRTSHLGGHRFAPTLIDFPEGRGWGHLEAADLDDLIGRRGRVEARARRYRGWGGLSSPFLQVAEREALIREGWGWTGYRIAGVVLAQDASERWARVRLDYTDPITHRTGAYEMTVMHQGSGPARGYEVRDLAARA